MASSSATVSLPVTSSSENMNKFYGWDRALSSFLKNAGLTQTLVGLENDMIVMNEDWEVAIIPPALQKLQDDLRELSQNDRFVTEPLSDRKLAYSSVKEGSKATSPKQMIREISELIAKNRARNNISNHHEFLRKRRNAPTRDNSMLEDSSFMDVDIPTCARTDAIPVNRDIQMKYGVAKNEGGPLMRTVKFERNNSDIPRDLKDKGKSFPTSASDQSPMLEGYSNLLERFSSLEEHLAVRYVPGPPASLVDRIKYLEDHIIRLERDYPPWAALHFNQPNRGWPPPPRATPLIIPSHLTSTTDVHADDEPSQDMATSGASLSAGTGVGNNGSQVRTKVRMKKSSSLHRAVMQKLEVKKALAGED